MLRFLLPVFGWPQLGSKSERSFSFSHPATQNTTQRRSSFVRPWPHVTLVTWLSQKSKPAPHARMSTRVRPNLTTIANGLIGSNGARPLDQDTLGGRGQKKNKTARRRAEQRRRTRVGDVAHPAQGLKPNDILRMTMQASRKTEDRLGSDSHPGVGANITGSAQEIKAILGARLDRPRPWRGSTAAVRTLFGLATLSFEK